MWLATMEHFENEKDNQKKWQFHTQSDFCSYIVPEIVNMFVPLKTCSMHCTFYIPQSLNLCNEIHYISIQ